MGIKAPEQYEALALFRNEFSTYPEIVAAVEEFPRCGQCKAPVKIAQICGRWFAVCTKRPLTHASMRRLA